MPTPNDDRLIRALRAAREARLSGALRVETDGQGATLFFEGGRMYFAVLDGGEPNVGSFGRHGISRQMLDEASRAHRADDLFADALMSVGAPAAAVRAFGHLSITTALTRLARLEDARFTADDRRHPYGSAFTFDVDELLETIGVVEPAHLPVASSRLETPPRAPTSEIVVGFRRRTGLKAAVMIEQTGL